MNKRASLNLLPIFIAVISFIAFSAWIWLSFAQEKDRFKESLQGTVNEAVRSFELAFNQFQFIVERFEKIDSKMSHLRSLELDLNKLPFKINVYSEAITGLKSHPIPLQVAIDQSINSDIKGVWSLPYQAKGKDTSAYVIPIRNNNGALTDLVIIEIDLRSFNEWWRHSLVGSGAIWTVFINEREVWNVQPFDRHNDETALSLKRISHFISDHPDTKGASYIKGVIEESKTGLLIWHKLPSLPFSVTFSAPSRDIRGYWTQHYGGLLVPLVFAAIFVVLLVYYIGQRALREEVRSEEASLALQLSEKRVYRSKERLEDAIESVGDGLSIYDADDRLVVCNSHYRHMFHAINDVIVPGVRYEQILRKAIQAKLFPAKGENAEKWLRARLDMRNQNQSMREEQLPDGRWLLIRESKTREGYHVSIRTDITQLKQREKTLNKLVENNRQLAAAVSASSVGLAIFNAHKKKYPAIFVNNAFLSTLDITEEDALDKPMKDLIGATEDLAATSILAEAVRAHQSAVIECKLKKSNGETFFARIRLNPVTEKDHDVPSYWVVVLNDITLWQESQTRLRQLSRAVDQSANLVIITDTYANIQYVNKKFEEVTGFSAKEVMGKNPRLLSSGKTNRETYKELWETVRAGNVWRGDLLNRRRDGSNYWVSATITPVKDERLQVTHYVAIEEDITAKKETERALRQAKEAALLSSRSKSEFMTNMSHELRTPLNHVIGFADLIKSEALGPLGKDQYRTYAEMISDSGNHLLEIVNDIMDAAQMEGGGIQLHKKQFNPHDLIQACVSSVKSRAQLSQVKFDYDIKNDLPILYGDDIRLKQVLMNLLSNAVKFTPENGEVILSAQYDQDAQVCLFKVKDTGVGIKENKQDEIFKLFSQADSSLTRLYEGAGLGLPLAKYLVQMHGGTIDFETETGKGTTFTVSIPVSPANKLIS